MKTKLMLLAAVCAVAIYAQNPVQRDFSCTDTGTANTMACSLAVAPASYAAIQGKPVRVLAAAANTGAATLNLNSLGAIAVKKLGGGITTGLAANDIRAGQYVTVVYDGTNFQMQSQLGNASTGSGVNFDCSDPTHKCVNEPFCPGATGTMAVGALGWQPNAATGTINAIATNTADHWCGYQLVSGTAANTSETINLGNSNNNSLPFPPMNSETVAGTYYFTFTTPATLTNALIEIGFVGSAGSTAVTDGSGKDVALRYLNDGGSGCNGSTYSHGTDSTWIYYARNGASNQTAAGPAIAANTDYTLRITTGTSGSIGFSLAAAGSALPADTVLSNAGVIPTTAMTPTFKIASCDGTAKTLTVYQFTSQIAHY